MIQLEFDGCHITHLTRDDWGGGPLRAGIAVSMDEFIGWYLHHTVMLMKDYDGDGFLHGDLDDICRYMRVLQTIRPDLGSEVPYSSLPFRGTNDRSCVMVDGRGPGWSGAHTAGQNRDHYAWSLPTDSRVEPPTEGQIAGMRWIASVWTPSATDAARGHRQAPPYFDSNGNNLNATACPGDPGIAVLDRLQPPYLPAPPKGWDEMATKAEIREVLAELLEPIEKRLDALDADIDSVDDQVDDIEGEVEGRNKPGHPSLRAITLRGFKALGVSTEALSK